MRWHTPSKTATVAAAPKQLETIRAKSVNGPQDHPKSNRLQNNKYALPKRLSKKTQPQRERRCMPPDVWLCCQRCCQPSKYTVSERAPWAPITSDCSMSAVLDGPAMNVPNKGCANIEPPLSPAELSRS